MTASDQYILEVIARRSVTPVHLGDARLYSILSIIRNWAGSALNDIKLSGSSAKNLVVQGQPDTDIFISIKSSSDATLKTIYESLNSTLRSNGIIASKRTVALNINYNGLDIDLVPGKVQPGYKIWHSLYNSESDSWLQTNIDEHIKIVKNSGRDQEIRAIKIWAKQNQLKFPSLYLESLVIDALYNRSKENLATNIFIVFKFLNENVELRRVVDPANTNNVLSSYMLTSREKQNIAKAAGKAYNENYWNNIIN
ncbi:hypothetical protein SAMN06265337_2633 [Hymenobacter gelipurpurascens]|uniref:Nucleotidyltransferase n=1 Tax=Hymenobacter gelipurpurascens TaxID=89968 RepID=A0A212U9J3_9BACT|nr:nucleotidyltransferase [Hymenobacter gelipurpurascens]SNC74958.1 hypothetical protein SAMN06265337_2633 [Hymenobacter gelipurpurascens]